GSATTMGCFMLSSSVVLVNRYPRPASACRGSRSVARSRPIAVTARDQVLQPAESAWDLPLPLWVRMKLHAVPVARNQQNVPLSEQMSPEAGHGTQVRGAGAAAGPGVLIRRSARARDGGL